MSKYQFLALAGVVACGTVAFLAVDRYTQSRNADGTAGGFDLSDAAALVGKVMPQEDAHGPEATVEAMLATYPAAPEGWNRRGWLDEDAVLIDPPREVTEQERQLQDAIANSATGKIIGQMASAADRRRADQTAVYQQGDQRIALHIAQTSARQPGGFAGMAMSMAMGNMASARPSFALVQGVPYRIERGGQASDPVTAYRIYRASVGDGIEITVYAQADEAAIYEVIAGIDYDALNGMLATPLADVGSHVPTLPLDEQPSLAAQMEAERIDRLRAEGARAEDGFKAIGGALATQAPEAQATADEASITTRIAGFFSGGAAEDEAEKPAEVRVNRASSGSDTTVRRAAAGGGSCQMVGAMKRCTVTSD
ncbi:hypothetical protein [Pseudooceanicola sp. LIPI14-2-Ac024]|uniref:hypothetical protein n=1 Tax=Pseudooceanicola sp. LIPI14-2-Ac024 TaxID=3344875 RepID=UPI0035D05E47